MYPLSCGSSMPWSTTRALTVRASLGVALGGGLPQELGSDNVLHHADEA
jgi:hypothetical protein